MKKFVLSVGVIFFALGMFIEFAASEAVLKIIAKNASGKEFTYWLETILATVSLTIPGMYILNEGLKKAENQNLQLFPSFIFLCGGVASLLRGMFAIYPHIGDDTGMGTFTTMIFSTTIQCFVAAFICLPKIIRNEVFD